MPMSMDPSSDEFGSLILMIEQNLIGLAQLRLLVDEEGATGAESSSATGLSNLDARRAQRPRVLGARLSRRATKNLPRR